MNRRDPRGGTCPEDAGRQGHGNDRLAQKRGMPPACAVLAGQGHLCGQAEREAEGRAGPRRAVGPDTAAVLLDDAGHDGQPHPRAGKFRGGVQALERDEQPAGILGGEARAVVAHEVAAGAVRFLAPAEDHRRPGRALRVFPRVREQILQRDAQERLVAFDRRKVLRDEVDRMPRVGGRQVAGDITRQRGQIPPR